MVDVLQTDAQEYALDRDCTTLSRHVLQQLQSFSAEAQDLSALMNRPRWQDHCSSSQPCWVNGRVLGFTGDINVQGESVKRWMYANDVLSRYSSKVASSVAWLPRKWKTILHSENCPIGRYTLLYDPIDGSSNTDINLSLGSIFAIRQQGMIQMDQPATCCKMAVNKSLQATSCMVLAPCWFIPSARSSLVHARPLRRVYPFEMKTSRFPTMAPFTVSMRVISGNGMSQFGNHPMSTTLKGHCSVWWGNGWRHPSHSGSRRCFCTPAQLRNQKANCACSMSPLAFLIEQAGGRTSTGTQEILDVVPEKLHQRTALIIGSKDDVALVESFIQQQAKEQGEKNMMARSRVPQ